MACFASLVSLFGQAGAESPPLEFHQETWFRLVVAVLIMVAAWGLGKWLSKTWRMPDYSFRFGLILFSLIAGAVICVWRWPPKLGIDLKGGVILIYEVAEEQEETLNLGEPLARIRNYLDDRVDDDTLVATRGSNQIVVTTPATDEETLKRIETTVEGIRFPELEVTAAKREPRSDGTAVVFNVGGSEAADVLDMDMLIAALNKRINPGGQKEIVVRKFGEQQVEIIIPEVDSHEIDLIKDKISTAGLLEFRIIANNVDDGEAIRLARANPSAKQIAEGGRVIAKWVTLDTQQMKPDEAMEKRTNQAGGVEVLVREPRADQDVRGGDLSRASQGWDDLGRPAVDFSLKPDGAVRFGDLTNANRPDPGTGFRRRLGIILDGRLFSAPELETAITSRGQIHGNFQLEEVQFLVDILNAGSLPAALDKTPVSETSISPQLGRDTIKSGSITMVVSTIMILVFMLVYYRFSGIVADVAVVMNLVLVVALMITLGAAFTLAGLAGLVLSVGMAVDANVLIYERMREELQRGAALRMAIRNGFARAMSTIIDSNLTTLLTGVVLYAIGTDQLKGFAITLILGLLLNLYTAVYVARTIFDVAERRRWITQLKMMKMFDAPSFDFVRPTKYAITASLLVIAGGLVAAVSRGEGLFGIDFTGGSSVQIVLAADQKLSVGEVRQIVDPRDESKPRLEDVTVSSVGAPDAEGKSRYYKIDTSLENIAEVESRLKQMFGDKLEVYQMSYTAPQAIATAAGAATAPAKGDAKAAAKGKQEEKTTPGKTDSATAKAKAENAPPGEPKDSQNTKEAGDKKVAAPSKDPDDGTGAAQGEPNKDKAKTESKLEQPQASVSSRPRPWLVLAATQALVLLQDEKKDTPEADAKQPTPPAKSDSAREEAKEPASGAQDAKPTSADKSAPSATNEKQASPAASQPTAATSKSAPDKALAGKATETAARPAEDSIFAGGSAVTLTFTEGINRDALSARLDAAAQKLQLAPAQFLLDENEATRDELNTRLFSEWKVQTTLAPADAERILAHVQRDLADTPILLGANTIGGKVAGHAQVMAIYAILASMVMIVIYVWVRFQNIVFGLAAVVALVHDVLVTIAALAVSYYAAPYLGWAMVNPFKISLDVVAALLTIVGFSINDTIVIFDRVREIKGKSPEVTTEMVNKAVNQTLGRTILTSGTVLIVTIILYIWGGQEIHPFAFAMLVGLVSGTYSTVYIAAPLVLWLRKPTAARKPASPRGTEVAMRA